MEKELAEASKGGEGRTETFAGTGHTIRTRRFI